MSARLISSNALLKMFANPDAPVHHSEIAVKKRLEALREDGYLEKVDRIKDANLKGYTQHIGRGIWYAPGRQSKKFYDEAELNNKALTDEPKLHLLMESQYARQLFQLLRIVVLPGCTTRCTVVQKISRAFEVPRLDMPVQIYGDLDRRVPELVPYVRQRLIVFNLECDKRMPGVSNGVRLFF